ncbi:MAG: MFS transporter [Zetaproteobacteria bacterium CG12_big_fil_rev_8_21_14_0_65_55_1124]|nr:MAG: MFS transporter [Zetaproteobacteria bacterium CG1_02_55_237]PIS19739.1 MAG: MFS transporter [Zetaproteobacteria bacterium CG08_land_8_20_14_0_20_55_17]PIW43505.1 MAG: MFS transporter [Zetaproteobacteria bacterium CG12_big_fil_rev_8_21_14_0_65_55_1124]PIY54135.1 MAG: MFS transporter [Zetaproteobacteria bacterium CG_4_10_14_0_8_um_filter_55_43]PIZ39130.1 MAG: MFS transporter [Zetaproteobacteria bacterium CG_4_10_14_0_2_um_filter_55_20]PJB81543.1 MAG: MFS transporter [Zetaproteobacteria b
MARTQDDGTAMNAEERRSAISLAGIFGLRMLGLFLILPVFAPYAHGLEGAAANPMLVGLALGAYGLTQAVLQIPFGMMSDRFGRKPVIAAGMLLFAIGSIVAAMSDSITGVLIGRIIQGSGAVAAAVIALTADLTREEHRTKAMAMIGMTIGVSFTVSMVLGPLLGHVIGVSGIFWLTGALALISILFLYLVVPDPKRQVHHRDAEVTAGMFTSVLRNTELLRLDFGVFVLHAGLTAMFVVLPMVLMDPAHPLLASAEQWKLYLPVMGGAFLLMIPLVIIAEAKRKMKQVFVSAILMLVLSLGLLSMHAHSLAIIATALAIFFIGFNALEATLPSLISKIAPASAKGTAVGVFNTCQFFGAFVGGMLGGLLYLPEKHNEAEAFLVIAGLLGMWLLVALFMPQPRHVATRMLHIEAEGDAAIEALRQRLLGVEGVVEVELYADEQTAYCKVDSKRLDDAALRLAVQAG